MSIRVGMRPMARPAVKAPIRLYCLDFTELTEVDPDGDFTITTSKAAISTMRKDAAAYVWGYYGADYFGDLEHRLDVELTAVDDVGYANVWMVSNEKGDARDVINNELGAIFVGIYRLDGTGGPGIRLTEVHEGAVENLDEFLISTGTPYYLVITRSGSTATCKIYSDAERTILLDTLTVSLAGTSDGSFSFLQTIGSKYDAVTPFPVITGYAENLCRLAEAWPTPGTPPPVWADDFDDNEIDLVNWDKYEVLNGVVTEQNQRLECSCPGHLDIAGLVSKNIRGMGGHTIEVDLVTDSTALQGIYLCPTKVTSARVYTEANWYRFIKDNRTNLWEVRRRLAGLVPTLQGSGAWVADSGTMKIVMSADAIHFYENGLLRHSELYALASTNVYIYIKTIGVTDYLGMDYFNNFEVT